MAHMLHLGKDSPPTSADNAAKATEAAGTAKAAGASKATSAAGSQLESTPLRSIASTVPALPPASLPTVEHLPEVPLPRMPSKVDGPVRLASPKWSPRQLQ